ncbi:MAG: sulfite exporter TauE/SafE family protein [Candidatus Bathyarchaeota archaeon]|nr:MAG: sulfite exporter TauE/SafE family protein [Candidatus Bathyarchaeota archaeon]
MIGGDFIALVIAGLACGFVDSSLGMGYGVTSASVLVSFGIAPAVASASVHTAEAFVDGISAGFHLKFGNVRKDLLLPLLICGTIGAILGAAGLSFLALAAAKPIVASLLLAMGLVVLIKFLFRWKKGGKSLSSPNPGKVNYSRKKIAALGFVAGIIDASGGGGWGPILTPAFVATGSNPKKAVGTVEFTEPIISFATFITFGLIIGFESFLWNIVLPILIGGIILTPIAAYVCSKTPRRLLGILVGLWVVALNIRTLLMALL